VTSPAQVLAQLAPGAAARAALRPRVAGAAAALPPEKQLTSTVRRESGATSSIGVTSCVLTKAANS